MRQGSLKDALKVGEGSEDDEVSRLSTIARNHMDVLRRNDTKYKEDDFYINVKEVCQIVVGCSLGTDSETVRLEKFYILTSFWQVLFASV